MTVLMPPILAAKAIPRITNERALGYFLSISDMPIGRNIAAVAVLLIHIDSKEVAPSIEATATHLFPFAM